MGELNAKENYLEAVSFGQPEYVPLGNEEVRWSFQFEGNYRGEDWTDSWGVSWHVGLPETVPFPVGNPLPSLEFLGDYRCPDPDALVCTREIASDIAAVDRATHIVDGHLSYLLFERAWAVMGMDNMLMALATHPREAHEFLHGIATYTRRVFDRYLEMGADIVSSSEDLGTQRALFMSPAMFREFFLTEYEYIFENVLAAGRLVHFHSCGCVEEIAADLASIGISILNPIQARANDLPRIKRDTCPRMALHGGIDTAVLAGGGPDDVRAEVVSVMEILKPGGGYICSPDQNIPGVPEENFEALWQTAREEGRYR